MNNKQMSLLLKVGLSYVILCVGLILWGIGIMLDNTMGRREGIGTVIIGIIYFTYNLYKGTRK